MVMRFALIFVLFPFALHAQQSEANTINDFFNSPNSHFVFHSVPVEVFQKIIGFNDSTVNHDTKRVSRIAVKQFIVKTNGLWNSGNVAQPGVPTRRFIFACNQGTQWLVSYDHGGPGRHLHTVFIDLAHPAMTSSLVSLEDLPLIDDLIKRKKVELIGKHKFEIVARENEFRVLKGHVLNSFDMF